MFQRDVSAISEIDGDDPSFDHFWLNEGAGERISNLVGGLEDVFFHFPFHIWDVILPTNSYFSRWLPSGNLT